MLLVAPAKHYDSRKRVRERGEGKMEGFKGQTQNLSNVSQINVCRQDRHQSDGTSPCCQSRYRFLGSASRSTRASERNSRDW